MKEFKIRASGAGKIMTGTIGLTDSQQSELDKLNDRKFDSEEGDKGVKPLTEAMEKKRLELFEKFSNPVLPKTLTSYCDNWIKEQLYGRRKEFSSKYTEKGKIMEDDSIDFIADQLGYGFLMKNEEQFEDDLFTGEPDVLPEGDEVIDAKNSWDCFTFPLFETEINPDYYAQGQVYLHLTRRKHFKLAYVLSDAPENLVLQEAIKFLRAQGYGSIEDNQDVVDEVRNQMSYSHIDPSLRIKVFEFDYDSSYIEELSYRVEVCRKYIKEKLEAL